MRTKQWNIKKHSDTRKKKGGMLKRIFKSFQNFTPFTPNTKQELQTAVDIYYENNRAGKQRYGYIGTWDVSRITDMSHLFTSKRYFDEDISRWNVSNVTEMDGMFNGATFFNQPLDNWNVGNVINMESMFSGAAFFNQPLNNWNVGNVINMGSMFKSATSFNQPLNNWNVTNVTNMQKMFNGAISFNQPLNDWNVSNVTNMESMFNSASSFNQPLNNWNVANVRDMTAMFFNARSFNQPLNNWNVANVRDMTAIFELAHAYTYGPLGVARQQVQREGRAYQVHNAFDNINFDLLFNIITEGVDIRSLTNTITPTDFYDWLNSKLSDNNIFNQNEDETQYLKNNLMAIRNKLIVMNFAGSLGKNSFKKFVEAIIAFVNSQPNEFIRNYIHSYIKDNIGAYSDYYDNNSRQPNMTTSSCVKGMTERIILNLRSGGMGLNNEKYIKIAKIIGRETIVEDNCETNTREITNEMITHFTSMCLNNPGINIKQQLLTVTDMDIRSDMLARCILRKLADEGHITRPEVDNLENFDQTLSTRIRSYLRGEGVREMYEDDYLTGGKRRNMRRKTRKANRKYNNKTKRTR
jgi:surface protein